MTPQDDSSRTPSGILERARADRQSFVLRVWLEEPARAGRRAPWRGRIIHLPTSAEFYSGDLDRIRDFIAAHLDRMGARLPLPRRLALWLARQTRRHASGQELVP